MSTNSRTDDVDRESEAEQIEREWRTWFIALAVAAGLLLLGAPLIAPDTFPGVVTSLGIVLVVLGAFGWVLSRILEATS